jgi:WhiB family transcriptional regulator, redox-sensing transcriptional regulator
LAEFAQGIPPLPGARCKGREELFDQTITQPDCGSRRHHRGLCQKAAVQVCAGCPALAQCAAWVDNLPRGKRPVGVVGGVLTDIQGRRWTGRKHRRRKRLDRNLHTRQR